MTRHLLRAAELPLALTMVLLSSICWTRGYADPSLGILLLIATALSVGIPHVFARILHKPFVYSLLASILTYLVFSLALVVRSPLGFADLGRGFGDGMAELLSNTLPLSGTGWILVVPVTACWLTGATVGEIAARTRSVGLPVVVALVGFAASYAATVGGLGDENGWAALLLLNAGALLFVRRWVNEHATDPDSGAPDATTGRDQAGWRPFVFGSVTLIVAAIVCLAIVPDISALQGKPTAPNRQPPELRSNVVTPVADIASLRRDSGQDGEDPALFDITLDRDAPGYVAVASLDEYDGDAWRYDRTYLPTGGRIPDTPNGGVDQAQPLDLQVDIHDGAIADRDWLPTIGRPLEVDGIAVRYDPRTGSVLPVEPLTIGASYRMATRAPTQLFSQLLTDGSASFDTTEVSTPLPDSLEENLDSWLGLISKDQNLPPRKSVEFFHAVDAHLRNPANYARVEDRASVIASTTTSTTAAPAEGEDEGAAGSGTAGATTGTSFGEIQGALLGTSQSGTPEQFATLFAVLARRQGIPARVVTGFRIVPAGQGNGLAPAGRHEVRASQAWTWVEVPVIGHGWVVVDPTPDSVETPQKDEAAAAESTTTTAAAPPPTVAGTRVVGTAPPLASAESTTSGRSVLVAIAVMAVPALVVAVLVALLLIRTRRRSRRRTRTSPNERAIGAWHETLDLLYEADVQDLEACTSAEVSTAAAERFGEQVGEPVQRIGQFANEAIFRVADVPAETVDLAWRDVDSVRAGIKEKQTTKERVRTFVRLAPRAVTHPSTPSSPN